MAAPGETRIGFMGLSCLLISSVLTTSLTSGVIRDLAQSRLVLAGCYGKPALHQNTVWRRGPDPVSIWSKLWWFFFFFCVFGEFVLLKTSSRVAVCLFSAQFKSMHEAFKDTAEFCGAFKKREAARVEKTQTNSLSLSVFNIYRINDVMSFKLRPLCTNSFMPWLSVRDWRSQSEATTSLLWNSSSAATNDYFID